MAKWVRLEQNTVAEIIPEKATIPSIEAWYGKDFARQCVCVPVEVMQNWRYDPETDTFTEPVQYIKTDPESEPSSDSPEIVSETTEG